METEATPQLYTPHCTTPIVIDGHARECGWKWNGPLLTEDSATHELQDHFIKEHGKFSMNQCSGYVKPIR